MSLKYPRYYLALNRNDLSGIASVPSPWMVDPSQSVRIRSRPVGQESVRT